MALELAWTAAVVVRSRDQPEIRNLLTVKFMGPPVPAHPGETSADSVEVLMDADAEEENQVKEEIMEFDMDPEGTTSPSKLDVRDANDDSMEIDDSDDEKEDIAVTAGILSTTHKRRTIAMRRTGDEEEDEDESDSEDEQSNHGGSSPGATVAPPNAGTQPEVVKLEESAPEATASGLRTSEVIADAADTEESRAATAADTASNANRDSVTVTRGPSVISISTTLNGEPNAHAAFSVPPPHLLTPALSTSRASKKALKIGKEDVALSSTGGSLLDPKLLRGPLIDLSSSDDDAESSTSNGMTTLFANLSELYRRGLAHEGDTPIENADIGKDDITLTQLFPEIPVYEFGPAGNGDKKDRRVDESGLTVGRLTATNRLMEGRNVLLSTLAPARNYRAGYGWADTNDAPVTDDWREVADSKNDSIPPAARAYPTSCRQSSTPLWVMSY